MATIEEKFPQEAWIHAYTDGSAAKAVADGGAGIHVHFPEGETTAVSFATGKNSTNYRAETEALMRAASLIQKCDCDCEQVVFLTDALSVLQALQNSKLPSLASALYEVAKSRRVALQWIPAHCGVPGNERADRLAKDGASGEQPNNSTTFTEKKNIIRTLRAPTTSRDDYHLLSREQQSVLVRLRTGHNRLNSHMHRKLKLVPSPSCPCGQGDQTAEHVLQTCPLFNQAREEVWPADTPLPTKLYGCLEELEKTTAYIARTGLTV